MNRRIPSRGRPSSFLRSRPGQKTLGCALASTSGGAPAASSLVELRVAARRCSVSSRALAPCERWSTTSRSRVSSRIAGASLMRTSPRCARTGRSPASRRRAPGERWPQACEPCRTQHRVGPAPRQHLAHRRPDLHAPAGARMNTPSSRSAPSSPGSHDLERRRPRSRPAGRTRCAPPPTSSSPSDGWAGWRTSRASRITPAQVASTGRPPRTSSRDALARDRCPPSA